MHTDLHGAFLEARKSSHALNSILEFFLFNLCMCLKST